MPAIARLMKRLGYVKLSGYGLVLTPEGRVLSMRPAVLDDGLGGRIVGWQDGDLAAMELEKWEPARPAPKAAVATAVAAPVRAARPPVPTRPVPVAAPATPVPSMIIRETSLPISVAQVPPIAPAAGRVLAPEPVVEEDDWEWTIAIARARAAAEEVELAAAQPIPAPVAAPKVVAARDPIAADEWPKTEPLNALDYNDYSSPMAEVVRVVRLANTPRVTLPAKPTPTKPFPAVAPVAAAPAPVAGARLPAREVAGHRDPDPQAAERRQPGRDAARPGGAADADAARPNPASPVREGHRSVPAAHRAGAGASRRRHGAGDGATAGDAALGGGGRAPQRHEARLAGLAVGRTGRALALVMLVAACGGGGKAKVAARPVGPAVDEKTAEKDAASVVTEIYETISHGNPDSLFSLLDDPLIVFGPRKADAMVTRSGALIALGKLIDPKAKQHAQLRSGSLDVVASTGGHSAWAFDVVKVDGQPMAVTAVLTNDHDLWAVSAAAIAETPSMRDIRGELKKVAVVPPGASSPAKVDDRAEGAADKFEKGLLEQQIWGDDLSSRTEALLIGPASGEITRGKKDIKKLWKKRMEAETRAAASGEISAAVTPDGQLAWVTAPITRVEKDEDPLPLRAFAVFEKNGDDWRMIALQESLAIDEPGAGAEFVKIVPPALTPPEPPPEVKDDKPPEKAKSDKKKKKKKKKKKRRDDDD